MSGPEADRRTEAKAEAEATKNFLKVEKKKAFQVPALEVLYTCRRSQLAMTRVGHSPRPWSNCPTEYQGIILAYLTDYFSLCLTA